MFRLILTAFFVAFATAANGTNCRKENDDGDLRCSSGEVRVMIVPPTGNGCLNSNNACFTSVMDTAGTIFANGSYQDVRRNLRTENRELQTTNYWCTYFGICSVSLMYRRRNLLTYNEAISNAPSDVVVDAFVNSVHPDKNTCKWSTNVAWSSEFTDLMKAEPVLKTQPTSQFHYYVQVCD